MTDRIYPGLAGAAVSLVMIIAFQTFLVNNARKRANNKRVVRFMDLVITCEDDSYSLSRLQLYLWSVAIIIGFSAVFSSNLEIPDINPHLYMLMGVNLAASVAASGINTAKNILKNPGSSPDFVKDIFFDADASLDLPRTQMFIWTIISLLAFVFLLIKSFYTTPALPDIPEGLIVLMGLSHGAYLGSKATAPLPASAAPATLPAPAPDQAGSDQHGQPPAME